MLSAMPSRRQSSAIEVSPRRPSSTMRILLFGRVVLPGCPPNVADKRLGRRRGGVGFLSHLRSLRATMSQKSSVPQAVSFVSQVLKRDKNAKGQKGHALAYIQDEDQPGRGAAANLLRHDEARRIAVNVAKLPLRNKSSGRRYSTPRQSNEERPTFNSLPP